MRGGVDDVPLALRHQPRHEGADAVDHAPQVDAQGPRPVGRGERPHRAGAAAHARVVADHVGRAEVLDGARRERRHGRRRRPRRCARRARSRRRRRARPRRRRAGPPRRRPAPPSCPRRRSAWPGSCRCRSPRPVTTATLPREILHASVLRAPAAPGGITTGAGAVRLRLSRHRAPGLRGPPAPRRLPSNERRRLRHRRDHAGRGVPRRAGRRRGRVRGGVPRLPRGFPRARRAQVPQGARRHERGAARRLPGEVPRGGGAALPALRAGARGGAAAPRRRAGAPGGRIVPFLALEWLEGEALDRIVENRRAPGQAAHRGPQAGPVPPAGGARVRAGAPAAGARRADRRRPPRHQAREHLRGRGARAARRSRSSTSASPAPGARPRSTRAR